MAVGVCAPVPAVLHLRRVARAAGVPDRRAGGAVRVRLRAVEAPQHPPAARAAAGAARDRAAALPPNRPPHQVKQLHP